jgi:hypothetical protein
LPECYNICFVTIALRNSWIKFPFLAFKLDSGSTMNCSSAFYMIFTKIPEVLFKR